MKTTLLALLALPVVAAAGGIFWSDRPTATKAIRACNFDGSGLHDVVTIASARDPRGVVVDQAGERIYFCDRASGGSTGEIDTVPIAGGAVGVVLGGLNRPADLRFNPATRDVFWCEEIGGFIRRVVLPAGGGAVVPANVVTLYSGLTSPYYLDYELAAGRLWWGTSASQIFRGPIGGGVPEQRHGGGLNLRGVCVDSAGGYFYWCQRDGAHVIQREVIEGGAVEDIYTGLDTPHGLVLDVPAGKMYWTDTGTNAGGGFNARGISRGDLNGATPAEIVVAGAAVNQPWDLDLDRRHANYAEWRARFFRYNAAVAITAATADPDGDGLKNAAEYALGTGPHSANAAPAVFRLNDGGVDYPAITFRRRTGTSDLTIRVQVSTDLATWNDNSTGAFTTQISATPAEDNMEIATVRSNTPLSTAKQFLRVKVELP